MPLQTTPVPPQHFGRLFALWLRSPTDIGAVAASSRALARAMAHEIGSRQSGHIVELGGGTGAITGALLERGLPPERLVVVERNRGLCRLLAARFPQVAVLKGDAVSLRTHLQRAGIEPVTAVVSGLPLLSMPVPMRARILAEAFAAMAGGGQFIQFTYSLRCPVPKVVLNELGLIGTPRRRIWLNLPPARVWIFSRRSQQLLAAA